MAAPQGWARGSRGREAPPGAPPGQTQPCGTDPLETCPKARDLPGFPCPCWLTTTPDPAEAAPARRPSLRSRKKMKSRTGSPPPTGLQCCWLLQPNPRRDGKGFSQDSERPAGFWEELHRPDETPEQQIPGGHGKHGKRIVLIEEELKALGLFSLQHCFAACGTLKCQKAIHRRAARIFLNRHTFYKPN